MRAVDTTRRDRITGAGVFGVAAALRVLYVAHAATIPAARYPMVDARAYHERALEILSGGWIGDGVFYQDPLYPYFLAGVYGLFGGGSAAVLFAQALLDAGTAWLVYRIARWVFDYPTAVIAGGLAATYKLCFYYDVQLLKVALTLFLITWALSLTIRAERRGGRAWFAAGASLGLAALTRGNYVLFPPLLLLWIGVANRSAPRRGALAAAWLGLGLATAILPVTLRNYAVGGDWVLITSQAGQNFYIGNHRANDTGRYNAPAFVTANPRYEEANFRAEAERRTGRSMRPSEHSRFWLREALREIGADPGRFGRHAARKAALFLNHYEVPDNQSYYFFREHVTPILKLPLPTYGALLPLAGIGMLLGWRRRGAAPLLLFFASTALSVVLFYNFSRYRMPVVPVVIVFAAAGAMGVVRVLRRRDWARAALWLAALGVGYAGVYRDLTSDSFATYHFNLALHHREHAAESRARAREHSASGDAAAALAAGERADALRDQADGQLRLALGARPYSRILARSLPGAVAIWAQEALDDGADERALALSRDLTTAFPLFARGHLQLGRSYARLGRDSEAAAALRRALDLAPNDAEAGAALAALEGNRQVGEGGRERERLPR